MNKTLLLPSLVASLLLSSLSQAEESTDTAAPAEASWSGNTELGFIQTSGNSDTQSFNGKFNIVRDLQPIKTAF